MFVLRGIKTSESEDGFSEGSIGLLGLEETFTGAFEFAFVGKDFSEQEEGFALVAVGVELEGGFEQGEGLVDALLLEVHTGEIVEQAGIGRRTLLLDLVGFFEEGEGFLVAALFEKKAGELVASGSVDGVGKLDLAGLNESPCVLPLREAHSKERQPENGDQDPQPKGLEQEGFPHDQASCSCGGRTMERT